MITIVAHRGAPRRARENTIKSFLAAVSLGADMIELDVRRTGDGVLVVFHDPWLSRKTRRPHIADLTYRELNKRTSRKGFTVPTLEETLRALSGKIMLDIELKEPGCEEDVLRCARTLFAYDKFIVTSFNPEIVAAVKSADADVRTGCILVTVKDLPWCEKTSAEVLAPEKKLFEDRRPVFAAAKKRGRKIAVWTVDSISRLSCLLVDPVVDAIITNHPDRALALRKKLCNG
jgi:glycerophosphoryl diester phosphodiesterase